MDERAVIAAAHAKQADLVIGHWYHFEGSGNLQPAGNCVGNFDFRGYDDIDGHVIAREQVGPHGF